MKKVLFFVIAFTLAFQAVAFAETKIGIVSIQHIAVQCEYGKVVNDKLKAKFEPMKNDLERSANELKKMENELKSQDLALSLEAKQDRQRDFRRKFRDHQDSLDAFNKKYQNEVRILQKPLFEKISKVIRDYGKDNGFSVILEASNVAVYVGDGIDISPIIIKKLDELKKPVSNYYEDHVVGIGR